MENLTLCGLAHLLLGYLGSVCFPGNNNNRKMQATSSVTLGEPKELPSMVAITYELAGELKLSFCHQVP